MKSVPLRIAAGLLAAVVLTSCGSDDAGDSGDSDGGEAAATVTTKFGDVEVPADVTNVVALGWGDAETALALGVQPVGASDWLGFGGEGVGPWAAGLYDQAPELIETMEPDFEAIAALEPDLILDTKTEGTQERHDRLTEIAPTVSLPEGADNWTTDTATQVEMIAAALGKEKEGEALLAELDEAFTAAAEENPEFADKQAAVAAYTSSGWGAYTQADARVAFMEKLGFTLADAVAAQESTDFSIPVSAEELDTLESDVLVTFPIFVEPTEITKQDAYQKLKVVSEGRALLIEDLDLANAYSLGTVASTKYAIEQITPLLAEAVAKG